VSLPQGVRYQSFGGESALATQGPPVYGEPTTDGWRRWDVHRSKLAGMIEKDLPVGLEGGQRVLYLGAAAGTTVSHVADFAGPTYAVEFAPRPVRDLLEAAESRENLFPLLKDARRPQTYAHIVEADLDIIVQDVATRGQVDVALANRQFLASDGRLLLAIKARSEDVTRSPESVFEDALVELEDGYDILATDTLDPLHEDHLAVVARPKT
jgi:fibrillarin-like pre-rRNA processing protein